MPKKNNLIWLCQTARRGIITTKACSHPPSQWRGQQSKQLAPFAIFPCPPYSSPWLPKRRAREKKPMNSKSELCCYFCKDLKILCASSMTFANLSLVWAVKLPASEMTRTRKRRNAQCIIFFRSEDYLVPCVMKNKVRTMFITSLRLPAGPVLAILCSSPVNVFSETNVL